MLDQRIDRRTIAGVCRTKAAGFGQPRVAFSGARMTGVKADNRGQQQRVGQSVREMKLPAKLVGDSMVKPQPRLAERHPGKR